MDDLAYVVKYRVTVSYTGHVVWTPSFKWETSCDVDLTYFPYDEHDCTIE